MSLWRRLVRWLAREDLLAAEIEKQESARFAYSAAQQVELAERLAYARSEMAGAQRMADAVLESVAERTGGGDDLVQVEDVAAAKRGLLH